MEKNFDDWHIVKKRINHEERIPTFRKGEIWWCSTGTNVGVEQDGKNILFERPILVIRKFNKRLFWGVPLTTKLKDFPFYFPLHFKALKDKEIRERRAILSQLRAYDSIRLTRHMGKLEHKQLVALLKELHEALGE